MASRQRPHALINQAQEDMRNRGAAQRQLLRQRHASVGAPTSASSGSTQRPRPPQLPGGAGYPASSPRSTSSRPAVLTPTSATAAASSPSSRRTRAASLEAFGSSHERWRSPSSARSSSRPGSARGDDEEFQQDMNDLEDLVCALGMRTEADPRPPTGGTSASASTTARGGTSASVSSTNRLGSPLCSEVAEPANARVASICQDPYETLTGAPRAAYELQHLKLPLGCQIERSPCASGQFFASYNIAEGPYTPATLTFWLKVFDEFPAPGSFSVRCTQRIFHPSIDSATGRVVLPDDCLDSGDAASSGGGPLSILLTLIRRMMLSPPSNALTGNVDAAMLLQTDPDEFRRKVRFTLGGGDCGGVQYDRVLQAGKTAAAKAKTAEPLQVPTPKETACTKQLQLSVMELEVLKDKFKSQAENMRLANCQEIEEL